MHEGHHGSCLCGEIRYEISAELKALTHCHCRRCQKAHGAAFATYASVPAASLRVSANGNALRLYESETGVKRQFCGACGSSLFWSDPHGAYPDWISIAVATLDTEFKPHKQQHSYRETGFDWLVLSDCVEPPGLEKPTGPE
jgi:hypothetical protein